MISPGGTESSGGGPGSSTSGGGLDGTSTSDSTTTTLGAIDTHGTTEPGDTGVVFLAPPDVGEGSECDLFSQNCPPGQKCMPWANDGGGTWNALRCSPLADDPAEVGEPCHAEGSETSGIDDCEPGSMCFYVDPKTLEGQCFPFCVGSWEGPFCEDPDRMCTWTQDMLLCVPACNPLKQDCGEGQACYPLQDEWLCGPDASGDLGGYGDPCELFNVCDPGLVCLDASTVPPGLPCEGAAGCCTELCDLSDPAGDAQCAGAAEGQTCQAWYEREAPPGYEDVGACVLPR